MPRSLTWGLHRSLTFYLQTGAFQSGAEGFEPLTSAVQRRRDGLQEVVTGFKIPAKLVVSELVLFPSFQAIYSGCCTVAP
jgi:hypothetical protein